MLHSRRKETKNFLKSPKIPPISPKSPGYSTVLNERSHDRQAVSPESSGISSSKLTFMRMSPASLSRALLPAEAQATPWSVLEEHPCLAQQWFTSMGNMRADPLGAGSSRLEEGVLLPGPESPQCICVSVARLEDSLGDFFN